MDTSDSPGSAPQAQALFSARSRLQGVCSSLCGFQAGSEAVFLETAKGLNGLVDRARGLVALSSAVVDRASGEKGRDPAEALAGEVVRMAGWLEASRVSAGRNAERLKDMLSAIDALGASDREFRQTVKRLRALSICTRIESARADAQGAGFDKVADDMGRLANLIEKKFGEVRSKAAALRETAEGARLRADDFLGQQEASSSEALARARASLASLQSISLSASALATRGASASAQLAQRVEQVLTSLQFHDITRQMIEHVVEELQGFEADASRSAPGEGATGAPVAWLAEAAELSRLEASQLRSARGDLERALGQIVDNLTGVASGVGALAEETRLLAGQSGEESLLDAVERGLGQASHALGEHASHEAHAAQAMLRVAQTVEEVAGYILTIEEIGEDVQLIALNAQVKAAKTGEGARGLGVLAEEIQQLAAAVRGHTTRVSHVLQNIAAQARALDNGEETDLSGRGAETIRGGLAAMVSGLREFHAELGGGIGDLLAGSEALTRDVDQVARRVSEQRAAAAALSTLERELEQVGAIAAQGAGDSTQTSERVRAAVSRYTMESERAIHHAVAAGFPFGGSVAAPSGGLGDNVELF